jgi:hypothetical protein
MAKTPRTIALPRGLYIANIMECKQCPQIPRRIALPRGLYIAYIMDRN